MQSRHIAQLWVNSANLRRFTHDDGPRTSRRKNGEDMQRNIDTSHNFG